MSARITDTDVAHALARFAQATGGTIRETPFAGGYDITGAYGATKVVRSDPGSTGEWNVFDLGTKREIYDQLQAAVRGIAEHKACHRPRIVDMLRKQWHASDAARKEERASRYHYVGDERRIDATRASAHEGGKLHGMALAIRAIYGDAYYEECYRDAQRDVRFFCTLCNAPAERATLGTLIPYCAACLPDTMQSAWALDPATGRTS